MPAAVAFDELIAHARRKQRAQPSDALAAFHLGRLLEEAGRVPQALRSYRRAAALDERALDAHVKVAYLSVSRGDWSQARRSCETVLRYAPENGPAAHLLGYVLAEGFDERREADEWFVRAIRWQPLLTESYIARFGRHAGDAPVDWLIAHACAEIGDRVRQAEIVGQLGRLFSCLRDREAARTCAARVRDLCGGQVPELSSCATIYTWLCEWEEAGRCYDRIRELMPALTPVLTLEHLAHLCRFERYDEARRLFLGEIAAHQGYRSLSRRGVPLWDGAPLDGRSILLWSDPGYGDTIQFSRLAGDLAAQGATTLLRCQPPLRRLMATLPGVDHLVASRWAECPPYDYECPGEFAFLLLERRRRALAAGVPYLRVLPELRARWRRIVPRTRDLHVGLVWDGETRALPLPLPAAEQARFSQTLADRFLPGVSAFGALADIPGVRLYSLQCGRGAAALASAPLPFPIVDLSPHLGDFADTAAAIEALDVIVSADTAVPHLAGALDVPCCLLLHEASGWRWQNERPDSPWYPSLRLFRQSQPDQWTDVVSRIALTIAAHATAKRGAPPPSLAHD